MIDRRVRYLSFFLQIAVVLSFLGFASSASAQVVLVDDFDQSYASNHLGGAYGIVAQGGEARYDFLRPAIPYLANNSALKVTYKLKSHPGYAFLWMKLGKHQEVHELSDYLDLRDAVFLSFKYQSKKDVDLKVELHEDVDSNGRYDFQRDRTSYVYSDSVKKFSVEGGWTKVLIPLKRFTGIKDWSKVLELVFVFEKDRAGSSGEVILEDLIFIKSEIKKREGNHPLDLVKDAKLQLNGALPAPGTMLRGKNSVVLDYQPGGDFSALEALVLEIKTSNNQTWLPVTSEFNAGNSRAELSWETFTFTPPDHVSMRIVARNFEGKSQVIAGPFENLKVPRLSDEAFLDLVSQKAFLYFAENQNLENGLFYDTTGGGDLSTAVTGFGLSALVIGAERGWMPRAEAARRVQICLESFLTKIEDKEGFYYHFLTPKTLKRAGNSEISTVDTALLLAGVITAGEYFGGDIKKMAEKLYKKANWDFYLVKDPDAEHYLHFHHGWTPEEQLVDSYWDYYTDETLLLDLLAIGAPKHSVPAEVFYKFQRRKGAFKDLKPFIYTWHGSLFSYQYANAWYDFSTIVDKEGVNWFDNSKLATLSNRAFVIDHSTEYKTYGPDMWGITSMRVPEKYIMHYGPTPNGQNLAEHDGTISPSGPAGSIVFTPYQSLRVLKKMYIDHPDLWGVYGFKDSINVDRYWISPIYYGLGEGILLLQIENFRSGLIWKYFGKNKWVQKGLSATEFKKDKSRLKAAPSLLTDRLKEIDAAEDSAKLDLIRRALTKPLTLEDLQLLLSETERRYKNAKEASVKIVLGEIYSRMIGALEESSLEAGRKYLELVSNYESRALAYFEEALSGAISEVDRLEVYREMLLLLDRVQDVQTLEDTRDRLAQELKDGVRRQAYNLAWALKWADSLDEETAFILQREFYQSLSAGERKTLFELLKRKTKSAFQKGDYRKAALLSEEQIRFMEGPSYRRVLVSYLDRTAKDFAEVQKYAEAERFYLKIIETYGDEKDRERVLSVLASMLEKKGDKERAVKEYEKFIERYPKSDKVPEALMRVANIESSLGNREKSILLLKRVRTEYSSTTYARDASYLLGMVYFHAHEYSEAIKVWEKFLQDYPDAKQVSLVQDYLERADKKEAQR